MNYLSQKKYYNKTATEQLSDLFRDDPNGKKDSIIATNESLDKVTELLHLGADPNASFTGKDGKKVPLVSFAASCCNSKLVKLLLDNGANPNTRDSKGHSLIGLALSSNEIKIATDDRLNNEFGEHVLESAKENLFDRVGTVNEILSHGINLKVLNRAHETPLHNLITGNLEIKLVKEKFSETQVYNDTQFDNTDFTPPSPSVVVQKVFDKKYEANLSKEDRDELIRTLISHGVDLNLKNQNGFTALHYATVSNDIDVANQLMLNGANLNAKSNKGFTPLHIAASKGTSYLVQEYITNGADAYIKDKKGRDSISFALLGNHHEIANYIRENAPEKVKTSCFDIVCCRSFNVKGSEEVAVPARKSAEPAFQM